MPQVSISLPSGLIQLMESKVKSGMYSSQSEVVREALRQFAATGGESESARFNQYLRDLRNFEERDLSPATISEIVARKAASKS